MSNRLAGKVGLVTGAGGGIGGHIASVLAREGCAVVVSDIDQQAGQETVERIRQGGGEASFYQANVTCEKEVSGLIEYAVKNYGGLHIAVNNAGMEPAFSDLHELSLDDWNACMNVNLTGVFLCCKHEVRHMRGNGGGSIINISSVAARQSVPRVHVYAAAKRGVLSLTSCVAVEGGAHGIRANAIMPGAINTRMLQDSMENNPEVVQAFLNTVPLARAGETEDVANAVLWLASDESAYVNGQYIGVCGGLTA